MIHPYKSLMKIIQLNLKKSSFLIDGGLPVLMYVRKFIYQGIEE